MRWISVEALSPREERLNRLARLAQITALLNGLMLVGLLILGLLRDNGAALGALLAGGLGSGAPMIVLLGLLANTGACLLLAVSLLGQENWAWLLIGGTLVANAAALVVGFWLSLLTLLPLGVLLVQMMQDRAAYHHNPVTVKELRGRMRGVRSFAIISVYLLLMGAFTVLLYLITLSQITGVSVVETGQLGRTLFRGVVGAELVLIVLIVPALTAGAVSGERERQTFDLLTTTLLPIPTFLLGKMVSALGYMALLVLAAIPLQAVAFLFGGISQLEIVLSVAGLLATALLLGAMGLYFSTTTERTLVATIRVYVMALVVVIGLPLLSSILFSSAYGYAVVGVGVLNTTPAQETATLYADMILTGLNPIATALSTQQILVTQQSALLFDVRLASSGALIPVIAPWAILLVAYLTGAGLLLLASVWHMRRSEG